MLALRFRDATKLENYARICSGDCLPSPGHMYAFFEARALRICFDPCQDARSILHECDGTGSVPAFARRLARFAAPFPAAKTY
eukprot:scaffold151570_cov19-Prasinocladus_malaysianus.AAC.1